FSDVDEYGYIDMIFVDPQHQRQGVARALLESVRRQARDLYATSLTADVSITARPFFESQGFFVEQRQEPFKQGVKLVSFRMRKELQEQHTYTRLSLGRRRSAMQLRPNTSMAPLFCVNPKRYVSPTNVMNRSMGKPLSDVSRSTCSPDTEYCCRNPESQC